MQIQKKDDFHYVFKVGEDAPIAIGKLPPLLMQSTGMYIQKKALGGINSVLTYLGRYAHRWLYQIAGC